MAGKKKTSRKRKAPTAFTFNYFFQNALIHAGGIIAMAGFLLGAPLILLAIEELPVAARPIVHGVIGIAAIVLLAFLGRWGYFSHKGHRHMNKPVLSIWVRVGVGVFTTLALVILNVAALDHVPVSKEKAPVWDQALE